MTIVKIRRFIEQLKILTIITRMILLNERCTYTRCPLMCHCGQGRKGICEFHGGKGKIWIVGIYIASQMHDEGHKGN
jgi:hypothetical protein